MSPFFSPPFLIAVLIALSVHEWAHAYAAHKLGDPTAKYEGRLTLNPLSHIDPLGALMFLTVGFGWGKPVPVNPRHFKNVRRDTALVSIAGPLSNLILAFIAFFALKLLLPQMDPVSGASLLNLTSESSRVLEFVSQILADSLFLNLGLMAFNLLPIAPLDGSKVLESFIPYRYEDQYEQFMNYGPYILLGLLVLERAVNFPLLEAWVYGIIDPVLRVMSALA